MNKNKNIDRPVHCSACYLLVADPATSADVPEAQPAGATNADIGDHIVHFSAQSTDQLAAGRRTRLQHCSQQESSNAQCFGAAGKRQCAGYGRRFVKTVNLTGQLKNVTMRQIDEGNAIYYIGEVAIANRETLVFDISVRPEGSSQSQRSSL